eukprot:SAG31_NODE_2073_length_6513_cov_9.289055_1_plen_147_part_00
MPSAASRMAAEAAKPLLGPASKDEGTEEAAPAPAVAAAGPLSEKSKTCSDAHCLVLFVVVWAINFGIFALALQRGDVYRLLYATDYQDNTCGRDAMAAKPWGFYPRLAEVRAPSHAAETGHAEFCKTLLPAVLGVLVHMMALLRTG